MEIIYILSSIILLISFILRKKSDKEMDIVGFVSISVVLMFCYNTVICFILTFFTIPCKLWILALINIAFSLILLEKTIKKKEIQKYTCEIIDIIYVCIIIAILLIIGIINFGYPFEINYISSDPSFHYLTSIKLAKEDTLMPNAEYDKVYGDVSVRKPVSYVNSGLLMKCFCEDLDSITDTINIFVGFGIVTVILIGISIYSLLKKYAKKKEHKFWAFIISIICTIGYPLNSLLSGFEYLTMGLLMICTIIDLVWYYENDILKFTYIVVMFGLLNFGLFFSYYMFIPFMYPGLWIYFCMKNYSKTKKIITRDLIILLLLTLLLPFVLGYIYHLAPKVYAIIINQNLDTSKIWEFTNYIAGEGFAVDGDIYVNLYSNMIPLLPLTVYMLIKEIKNQKLKNSNFLGLILLFSVLFIEILLIGNKLGRISLYYLSKNYFALWIILAVTNYKALIYISETKFSLIAEIFIYGYIMIMIVYLICVPTRAGIRATPNPDENIFTIMDVFNNNKSLILYKTREYNKSELELMEYAKENLNFNSRIEIIGDHRTYYWAYVLLGYVNIQEEYNEIRGQKLLSTKWEDLIKKSINTQEIDYLIYFNKSQLFKLVKEDIFKNSEIIYENSSGGILKYNN